MELDDRKKRILSAIIEDYISTAEPVGSRVISKNHDLKLSPATIRNEMADLEEMGLLTQPHTSSGRIPTNLGYRHYVDHLMNEYDLSDTEIGRMCEMMQFNASEIDRLISETASIFAKLTNYTVVLFAPTAKESYAKKIHLLSIEDNSFLMVIVDNENAVKTKLFTTDYTITTSWLTNLSTLLNETFSNIDISKMDKNFMLDAYNKLCDYAILLPDIFRFIGESLAKNGTGKAHLGGVSSILSFPEYSNIHQAREILSYLENENNLRSLANIKTYDRVKVIIGDENDAVELKNCSVVLSTYTDQNHHLGTVGLIGPTRMNYSKVAANVEFLTKQLNKLLGGSDVDKED